MSRQDFNHYPAQPYSAILDTVIANGGSGLTPIASSTILGNGLGDTAFPQALNANAARTILGLATFNSPTFSGLTLTGLQSFTGTSSVGLRLKSLTSVEYGLLIPGTGDLFVDSTADRIDARLASGTVQLLDTRGNQTVIGAITLGNDVAAVSLYASQGFRKIGGGIWYWDNPQATGQFVFRSGVGFTERFRIDASGNLTASGTITASGKLTASTGINIPNNQTIEFAHTSGYLGWLTIRSTPANLFVLGFNNGSLSMDPVSGSVTSVGPIVTNSSVTTSLLTLTSGANNVIRSNAGFVEIRNAANSALAGMNASYLNCPIVQLGSGGPAFRTSGGTIQARDAANSADAPITCSNLTASGTLFTRSGIIGTRATLSLGDNTARFTAGALNTTMESGTLTGIGDDGINLILYPRVTAGTDGLKGGFRCRTYRTGEDFYTTVFDVSRDGNVTASGTVTSDIFNRVTANTSLTLYTSNMATAEHRVRIGGGGTLTNSSGIGGSLRIDAITNQTGTAGSTDLLINRTETALGSGAHNFADFQVGGVSRWRVDRLGDEYFHDGANYTKVSRAAGASGRLRIYRPNSTTAIAVQFGTGNDELIIGQSNEGSIRAGGGSLSIGSAATLFLDSTTVGNITFRGIANATMATITGVGDLTTIGTVTSQGVRLLQTVGGTQRGMLNCPSWSNSYVALQNSTLAETAANCGFSQGPTGETVINAASGTSLWLRVGNSTIGQVTSTGLAVTGTLSASGTINANGGIVMPTSGGYIIGAGAASFSIGDANDTIAFNAGSNLFANPITLTSGGPLLRNNAGTINARNNANNADVPFQASTLIATGTSQSLQLGSSLPGNSGNIARIGGSVAIGSLVAEGGTLVLQRQSGAAATITYSGSLDFDLAVSSGSINLKPVTNLNVTTGTNVNSNGVPIRFNLATTYNQTGTAGSTDIQINRTETALGSGAHNFADFQVGGSSRFSVSNTGNLTASGTVIAQTAMRVGAAGANAPYIFPFTANTHSTPDPTGRGLSIFSIATAVGTTSIAIAGDTATQTSGLNTHLLIQRAFLPTSGTGTYSVATITTTINQTGGANGITRGLFINPTLTAAADFRGIEVGNCGAQKAIVTGTGLVSFGDSVSITGNLTASGTLRVGGGTVVASILSATATLDFPSISSNGTETLTMTVTGAIAGDSVFLGVPATLDAGLIFCASVTAADTVTVRLHNSSGSSVDPASGTFRATVIRF
jgi:hypothetical protein